MDWNWFFSTIAQSSAAIVGIFTAFLISKILTNQSVFLDENSKLDKLLIECQRIKSAASDRYIDWCVSRFEEAAMSVVLNKIHEGENLSAEEYFNNWNFTSYCGKKDVIDKIQKEIDDSIKVKEERKAKEYESLRRTGGMGRAVVYHDTPRISPLTAGAQEELEKINGLYNEAAHQARVVRDFVRKIAANPESSQLINFMIVMVTVLFFFGVVYPMSFLPQPLGGSFEISLRNFFPNLYSIKGLFLLLIALIFCPILIVFLWMNMKMKYSVDKISELSIYTEVGAYSKYFSIRRDNDGL